MKCLILFMVFAFSSCSSLKNTKLESDEGSIVHFVLLSVGDESEIENVINAVKVLRKISYVQNFEVGEYKELGDTRALSEFEIVIKMEFKNESDYKLYQENEIHISTKTMMKSFLNKAPKTYHYKLR